MRILLSASTGSVYDARMDSDTHIDFFGDLLTRMLCCYSTMPLGRVRMLGLFFFIGTSLLNSF